MAKRKERKKARPKSVTNGTLELPGNIYRYNLRCIRDYLKEAHQVKEMLECTNKIFDFCHENSGDEGIHEPLVSTFSQVFKQCAEVMSEKLQTVDRILDSMRDRPKNIAMLAD